MVWAIQNPVFLLLWTIGKPNKMADILLLKLQKVWYSNLLGIPIFRIQAKYERILHLARRILVMSIRIFN